MNLMKWSQGSEEASPAAAITTKTPKQRKAGEKGKERGGEREGKCYSLAKVRHELVVVFAFRSLQLVYR